MPVLSSTSTTAAACGSPTSQFGHMATCRGVRGWLYGISFVGLVTWATVGYGLVYSGYLPPDPTDDYCGMTAFVCLWLPVYAFVNNPGEHRTQIQKWEEFVFMWLLTSGLCQVTFLHAALLGDGECLGRLGAPFCAAQSRTPSDHRIR